MIRTRLAVAAAAALALSAGASPARSQAMLLGSLDCLISSSPASFAATGRCTYWFGFLPISMRANLRVIGRPVTTQPVRAIWGVYAPFGTISLTGSYVRAPNTTILVRLPESVVALHPLVSAPGEDPTINIAPRVYKMILQ